jgi:cell division septation protein DedD
LNRKAAETVLALAVVDKAGESGAPKRRTWLYVVALAAVAVITAIGGYYLNRAISSVGQGDTLTTVAAAEKTQPVSKAGVPAGSSAQAVTDHTSENGTKLKVTPPVRAAETAKQPEKIEAPEQIPTRPRIVVPTGNFALQIAARPDEAEAKKIAEQMQDAGARARVVRAELPNRGTWYRVYVGAFETRAEAESYGAQLKRAGTIEEFLIADLRHR